MGSAAPISGKPFVDSNYEVPATLSTRDKRRNLPVIFSTAERESTIEDQGSAAKGVHELSEKKPGNFESRSLDHSRDRTEVERTQKEEFKNSQQLFENFILECERKQQAAKKAKKNPRLFETKP